MNSRMRFYVAGLVATLAAYIFATVAFTGMLDLAASAVFGVVFIVIFAVFERFMIWAERLESGGSTENHI